MSLSALVGSDSQLFRMLPQSSELELSLPDPTIPPRQLSTKRLKVCIQEARRTAMGQLPSYAAAERCRSKPFAAEWLLTGQLPPDTKL